MRRLGAMAVDAAAHAAMGNLTLLRDARRGPRDI